MLKSVHLFLKLEFLGSILIVRAVKICLSIQLLIERQKCRFSQLCYHPLRNAGFFSKLQAKFVLNLVRDCQALFQYYYDHVLSQGIECGRLPILQC